MKNVIKKKKRKLDSGTSVDRVKNGPIDGDFVFMFSFSFFFFHDCFFFEKMSSLFSCISCKHVSLLALVPNFNNRCFVRGRRPMVMWCADDIGRDSWGLGWAAWSGESMIQLPQSGVEALRLLKRSLPRLYCCYCCLSLVVVLLLSGFAGCVVLLHVGC